MMSGRRPFYWASATRISLYLAIIWGMPTICHADVAWDFEDPLPQTGLPGGWSKNVKYGNWSSFTKVLNQGSGKVLAANFDPPVIPRILYYDDGSSSSRQAVEFLPSYITQDNLTEVFSPFDFANSLTFGNYGLAIYFQQDGGFPASEYDLAFDALADFVAGGGLAIANDYAPNSEHSARFGAYYRPSLGSSFTITDPLLAEGLDNSINLNFTNGWALEPTTGTSAAEFEANQGSTIVIGNVGRSIFNSFASDSFFSTSSPAFALYQSEIAYHIAPALNAGGGGLNIPGQPQIQLDAISAPFQIPTPSAGTLSFDFDFNVSDASDESVEVDLVNDTNPLALHVATLEFANSSAGQVVVSLADRGIQSGTSYRLRVRVQDGNLELTTINRVEIDNILITGGAFLAGVAGDYNGDDVVNLADYNVWRNNLGGPGSALQNRGDGISGVVGADDYDVWKSHFGDSLAGAGGIEVQAVPEPATIVLTAIILAWLGVSGRKPSRDSIT